MQTKRPEGSARSQAVKLRKAKDQLAIEGKASQLANLRAQIERNVAASAFIMPRKAPATP